MTTATRRITPCRCGGDGGCPCDDAAIELWTLNNPSGLTEINYRIGDFTTFRRRLLQHLPGESELAVWRPTAGTDLGLQVLDWWAYIADILTFYTERIANETYLDTATLAPSVRRLVALLGYRPRPGIGATGSLAVIAARPAPLTIPPRLAVASKASPALDSQTFETTAAVTFTQPTSVPEPAPDDLTDPPTAGGPPASTPPGTAEPPPYTQLIARGGVLVKGTPTAVRVGDRLLLIAKPWQKPDDPANIVAVTGLVPEKDPHGRTNTRVLLSGTDGLGSAKAGDFRLARPTRSAHLDSLPTGVTVIKDATSTASPSIVLDSTARYLQVGDPLLIELPGDGVGANSDTKPGEQFAVLQLTAYTEVLWYANGDSNNPSSPPATPTPGIPLMLASLAVAVPTAPSPGGDIDLAGTYGKNPAEVTVSAGWADIGVLLDTPAQTLTALPDTVTLAGSPAAQAGVATPALVEDANGNGAAVTATPTMGTAQVTIAAAPGAVTLQSPLRLLWDLVTVTRGATVTGELLGTGDATLAGEDFTLTKAPVTYLADAPGRSHDGYSSTITLSVDGRIWTEVPFLYGHGPDETLFATYEDDAGHTHVRTGDGITGARLPSGAVVRASYRVGSGAAVPPPGALSQVLTPVPNLLSVRNPVPPTGGADPDPADQLRRLAPRSALTLGRAISGDDYAAVAAAAPGVSRAAAVWGWDADEQRPVVQVYVGDDDGAVTSATTALREQSDANRPLTVLPAVGRPTRLSIALRLDPTYVPAPVFAGVRAALLDPPGGLFAPGVLALGETLYRSRIEEVVCAVPGVLATHHVTMSWRWNRFIPLISPHGNEDRYWPGDGGYFQLDADGLRLDQEVDP
ncbi:hypothetical protein FK531_14280 [Rhodococcus spelaei]|uniref:Uncharacterized protein n=1 Tax=Rhodococcus spelaei TaxID=2546320 RepID=A0A541B7H6_9NOCA|nr:baseplate J/gp47 family protein [Rhodococcus spelaei]TQF68271.1 hypothetical protein FK531_14280 [Rhodococcus spelaei]